MVWKVEFQKDAEKELSRIDRQQAKRILRYRGLGSNGTENRVKQQLSS